MGRLMRMRGDKPGFTLIELLVVIVIIGMLLGVLLPAVNAMRERGRIAEASSLCAALENAIFAYYQQYGEWPVPNSRTTYKKDNEEVLERLDRGHPKNYKNINFIQIENYRFDEDIAAHVDPWNKAYKIVIDTSGDGDPNVLHSREDDY